MSKKDISRANENAEEWRKPATGNDRLEEEIVGVVMFDPRAVLKLKEYATRKFEEPKGVTIKLPEDDKEKGR